MLRTTFQNTITTPIPSDIPPASVLKYLQTPSNIMTLSPIVTHHSLRGPDLRENIPVEAYDVWENVELLPLPGPLGKRISPKYEIQFSAAFARERRDDEGCTCWVDAPMGFRSRSQYLVKAVEGEDGGWMIEEIVESSVNIALKWVVEGQLVSARTKMHLKVFDDVRRELYDDSTL